MGHPNARLTPHGRLLAVERVAAGHRVGGCRPPTRLLAHMRLQVVGPLPQRRPGGTRRSHPAARITSPGEPLPLSSSRSATRRTRRRRCRPHRSRAWDGCGDRGAHHPPDTALPRLCELDPLTGQVVHRRPQTAVRYERAGAGRACPHRRQKARPHSRQAGTPRLGRGVRPQARRGQGFDYLHAAIDDHSRLAYAEIHPDERGATCAGFLERAADFFAVVRHHPHRAGDDRQCLRLPPLA